MNHLACSVVVVTDAAQTAKSRVESYAISEKQNIYCKVFQSVILIADLVPPTYVN